MREIIASIDIGSSKIKLVVGEILDETIKILCALDEDSRGVVAGKIVESSETEYAIKKLLKKAHEILGVEIKKTIISVPEENVVFKIAEASIKVSSQDKEVSSQDIIHVLQAALKGTIDKGYELVTIVPTMFKVDDRKTKMPKNMHGDSLSVKSVVTIVPKEDILVTAKAIEKCGVEVSDVCIPSIGSYYAHKNDTMDMQTGVVIDIGSDLTEIGIVNKGILVNLNVTQFGGRNIDKDINYIYKISEKDACKLKEDMGLAHTKYSSTKESKTLVNELGEKVTINQRELAEIISSRLVEIVNMAKNEINYLTKKEISYIIITGGLSELNDFSLATETVFGASASVGSINIVGARDNKFATCIGMIKYFDYKIRLRDKEYSIFDTDDLEQLSGSIQKKGYSADSLLGKVVGIFFDN